MYNILYISYNLIYNIIYICIILELLVNNYIEWQLSGCCRVGTVWNCANRCLNPPRLSSKRIWSGKICVWFKRLQVWKTWGPISLDEWSSPCPKRGLFFHCLLRMSLWSFYGLMLRDFWENNRHNQSHDCTHVTPGAQQLLPPFPTNHGTWEWTMTLPV